MPEIVFKKDHFLQFRATKEIALGGIRPLTGYRTFIGEVVEFDGFKLKVGSGESTEAPHIRAAITTGWFVPHDGSEQVQPPLPAPTPAAPSRIPLQHYEEQIVATRTGDKFQTESPAARILSRFKQALETNAVETPAAPAPAVQEGRRKFALTQQEEFEGEGIPIKSLRPVVQEIPKAVGAEGVYQDQREVTNINPSIRTEGAIKLEDSAKVHKGSTDSVILGKTAVVGTNKDSTPQQVRKMTLRNEGDDGIPVSRLKTPTSFGATQINATTSVDSAIAQVERQARVVPGVVEHATDPILETLQAMVPGFSWNKERSVEARLSEARNITDPMTRRAILIFEAEIRTELQEMWA